MEKQPEISEKELTSIFSDYISQVVLLEAVSPAGHLHNPHIYICSESLSGRLAVALHSSL
jgi:hypothetical protein